MRSLAFYVAVMGTALVLSAGTPRAALSADCVAPDAPSLPLKDEPRTRIVVNRYLAEVKVYFGCAGEAADPAVTAEYERVVTAWTKLIRLWGKRNRR